MFAIIAQKSQLIVRLLPPCARFDNVTCKLDFINKLTNYRLLIFISFAVVVAAAVYF